jgi:hypothetical protein
MKTCIRNVAKGSVRGSSNKTTISKLIVIFGKIIFDEFSYST